MLELNGAPWARGQAPLLLGHSIGYRCVTVAVTCKLELASGYVNLLEMKIYTERDGERVDLDLSELRTYLEGGRIYYPGTETEIPRDELYMYFQIVEEHDNH